jgi:hypothetical protein
VAPRTEMDQVKRRKSYFCRDLNADPLAVQQAASSCIDCANPASFRNTLTLKLSLSLTGERFINIRRREMIIEMLQNISIILSSSQYIYIHTPRCLPTPKSEAM